jgi:radical SAM protein with 4Fe4S-binding SPASM domain
MARPDEPATINEPSPLVSPSATDTKVDITKYGYTVLQIETIASCNMACTFCAYPTRDDQQSRLPEDLVHQALLSVNAKGNNFQHVCFSQFNEPLMDPRVSGFIRFAQEQGFRTKLITNGLLLQNQAVVDRLLEAPPDQLKISLQTPRREQYEEVRGVMLDFDRYIEGIQQFLSRARHEPFEVVVDVGCNFLSPIGSWGRKVLGLRHGDPAVPNSVNQMLPDIREFLKGLADIDSGFDFSLRDAEEQIVNATSKYWEEDGLKLSSNIRFKIKPFGYGRRLKDFAPTNEAIACTNNVLGVLADGSVVPCCMAYNTNLAMGNLRESALSTILDLNLPLIDRIKGKTNQKPEVCKRCLGQPTRRGNVTSQALNVIKPVLRRL